MTIEKCYQLLGGDYKRTASRFPREGMLIKYLLKFLEDGSFEELARAIEAMDKDAAFRGAHTIKGLSLNLGLESLARSASELTEKLRSDDSQLDEEAMALFGRVEDDYKNAVSVLKIYLSE
ncbi:MAG: Hpt domain-containing protein [Anaerotardibacter sp.]